MTPSGPTLVIADGDLPSLLGCAAVYEAARGQKPPWRASAVWPNAGGDPRRAAAIARQADLYELPIVGTMDAPMARAGMPLTHLLLNASHVGAREGLASVLWPVHAGAMLDLAKAEQSIERAACVTRLAALGVDGSGVKGVEVCTPYADFTDDELADVALDMDLPLHTCWWYEGDDESALRTRHRWGAALVKAGWRQPASWAIPPINVANGAALASRPAQA